MSAAFGLPNVKSMFGAFRYVLALLVAESHLFPSGNAFVLPRWAGIYAVFGFYVLSGYLISRALETHYPLSLEGIGRFVLNRALRLYPAYLIAFALALAAIAAMPETMAALNRVQLWPADAIDWLRGLSIVGLVSTPAIRPIPPAWSVGVEICAYLLMALGLSRWRPVVIAWLLAAVAYHVSVAFAGSEWGAHYYPFPAALLPFAIGACLWHFRSRLPRVPLHIGLAVGAVFVLHTQKASEIWGERAGHIGMYVSLALVTVVVLSLSQTRVTSERLRRIDSLLGDLAYPLFLLHWSVGGVMWKLVSGGAAADRDRLFALTLIPVHVAAAGLVLFVDPVVARYRDRVRGAPVSSRRSALHWTRLRSQRIVAAAQD